MNQTLMRYDLRKVRGIYLLFSLGLVGYLLMVQGPLGVEHVSLQFLAILFGWSMSLRLFLDEAGTQSFVFSRGMSRARIFWSRWLLGMGLMGLLNLLVTVLFLVGIRSWCQRGTAGYFPVVAPYELSIIPPMALLAAYAFCVQTFLTIHSAVVTVQPSGLAGSASSVFISGGRGLIGVLLPVFLFQAMLGGAEYSGSFGLAFEVFWSWTVSMAVLVSLLATWAARHGFQHAELTT